ncbi:MAG: 3-deoxy-D-manno-octulosonic acid transferase [Melioribacteraceae bacterium]|nr:3-deoxy-D-manno-octulosonic acid transferase [Melioribacteraceae bacterium]
MSRVLFFIYNFIFLPLLYLIILVVSKFDGKIKTGLNGRKNLFTNLVDGLEKIDRTKKLVWFHSSSLGEFEQAKPIIQRIKEDYDVNILVTFFSPSGLKNSLKYPYADIISYLPFDRKKNVVKFIEAANPAILVLMRYDIWPNLVKSLYEKNIPCFIAAATMRSNSNRKLPVIKQFHTYVYKYFTKILTVSETDLINFRDFAIDDSKLKVVGDTRFDRVYMKSLQARQKKLFADGFFDNKKVFVFGSSWEPDEDVIIPAFLKLLKFDPSVIMIIAPHEPTILHLEKIENTLTGKAKFIRFSFLNNYTDQNIIIIDSIGILLTLYYYADVTYVGGSFKKIHNVLEPAVYGPPVLFGPKIESSQEAVHLSKGNGGIIVRNKKEAYRVLRNLMMNDSRRKEIGERAKNYVLQNTGATERIIREISKHIN